MFIFDFVAETILDQILDWIYGKIIEDNTLVTYLRHIGIINYFKFY